MEESDDLEPRCDRCQEYLDLVRHNRHEYLLHTRDLWKRLRTLTHVLSHEDVFNRLLGEVLYSGCEACSNAWRILVELKKVEEEA